MTAVSTPLGGQSLSSEISNTRSKTSWDYVGPQSQEVQNGLLFISVFGLDVATPMALPIRFLKLLHACANLGFFHLAIKPNFLQTVLNRKAATTRGEI